MSLWTRVGSILAAVAFVAGSASAAHAQAQRSVYASVLDGSGAPVQSLAAKDFVVHEDGVSREVLRAVRADDPLQVAVLVDTSQAVERDIPDIRRALRGFFDAMAGESHEFALIGFGERPTVLSNFTRDRAQLEKGIGLLFARPGSGAYALDAIVDASRTLRLREGARRVIVVITTEGPEFSNRYHESVLEELRPSASLHAFVLTRGRGIPRGARRERELTLAEGATDTGGRREHLLTSLALPDRLLGLAAELNNQYRVDYSRPATLVPPEKIDVSVKRDGVTVRAPRVLAAVRTGT